MKIRLCILVPTYNNAESILQVCSELIENTELPVLVVDDGSSIPVETLLGEEKFLIARASGRLTILCNDENRGKGFSLERGFRWCITQGYTHALAFDGDGQHLVSEIPKLLNEARENPWALIVGSRKFQGPSVPEVSRFGRKFSNFWVRFQTEMGVSDSQSGLRVYPLFFIQRMNFFSKRFDFEIEVLVRLMWRGVAIRDVEVACYYPPAEERISHFDKLWDNVRISLLNTVLVVVSLLRTRLSPIPVGVAVALGVWVGTTPFFGFHALICAGLSFVFRLNFLMLLLGSQISIPPIAPFLSVASIALGENLFGLAGESKILGMAGAWLAGSLVLGAILGLLIGGLVSILLYRVKSQRANWQGKTRGGRFGNAFMKFVAQKVGLRVAYFFLYFIVPYFYFFSPSGTRASNHYWKQTRPEVGFWKRQWLVLCHYMTFAKTLLDRILQSGHENSLYYYPSQGGELLHEALDRGEGIVLIGSHVGNWHLALTELARRRRDQSLVSLEYQSEGLTFDKAIGGDASPLTEVLSSKMALPLLEARSLLERGQPLGMMIDRPGIGTAELIPFFGGLAAFDATPIRLAMACRKRILFTFSFKDGDRTYRSFAFEEIFPIPGEGVDRETHLHQALCVYATRLESMLRRYPDQWFNFFPFWSRPPFSPLDAAMADSEVPVERRKVSEASAKL